MWALQTLEKEKKKVKCLFKFELHGQTGVAR